MPEGPDNQKNLMGEPTDKTMGDFSGAKDSYKPYDEAPADENIPQEEEETAPDYPAEGEEEQNTAAEQAQLAAQQQAEMAISLADSKQRQLLQIQKERQKLEEQLGELEKDLTDFKNSKLGGFLSIFQPRINLLIDILIDQLKKQASKLSDEAKIGYYTGLIALVSSIIAILTALKFLTAFLDAAFIDSFSCLRLVIASFATCIIPIILVLISPIYISFLALIFIIGKIPLLKGMLTKNIIELIEKLKKQRTAWQTELDKAKKKVTLQKQIKSLKKMEKQVAQKQ